MILYSRCFRLLKTDITDISFRFPTLCVIKNLFTYFHTLIVNVPRPSLLGVKEPSFRETSFILV